MVGYEFLASVASCARQSTASGKSYVAKPDDWPGVAQNGLSVAGLLAAGQLRLMLAPEAHCRLLQNGPNCQRVDILRTMRKKPRIGQRAGRMNRHIKHRVMGGKMRVSCSLRRERDDTGHYEGIPTIHHRLSHTSSLGLGIESSALECA